MLLQVFMKVLALRILLLQNLTLIGEDSKTTIIQGPWNNSSVVTILLAQMVLS